MYGLGLGLGIYLKKTPSKIGCSVFTHFIVHSTLNPIIHGQGFLYKSTVNIPNSMYLQVSILNLMP